MSTFNEFMPEYRKQMRIGAVPKAYKGLMEYIMALRTHFNNAHPEFSVSALYFGYMDMTYFAVSPKTFKDRKLKAAVVFVHETGRFEIWLSAVNKQVQGQVWNLLKSKGWNKYPLVSSLEGMDSIIEHTLVENPDFSDLNALTRQLETSSLKFVEDVESFFESN